jgi:integrase
MANTKVALLRYCLLDVGWRRLTVTPVRKGRGWAEQIKVPAAKKVLEVGEYQLRWYEGGRSRFEGVGKDLQEAITSRDNQLATLEAERAAAVAGRELAPETPNRIYLPQARTKFLEKKRLIDNDRETVTQYEKLTTEFLDVVKKKFADELEEVDLLRFCDALRKRGCEERTVKNYYSAISTFLATCGVDHKKLVAKENRPKKEDPLPVEYDPEDVKRFLAACNSEQHSLVFGTFLKTGCREQELAFLEWTDLDWRSSTITIRGEKRLTLMVDGKMKVFRFRTKTRKPREIPIEPALLPKLKAWEDEHPNTRFVFGTSSDLPNGHFLDAVKRTARRADLNCGKCRTCIEKNECEHWNIKTFRSTFATWALRGGLDIRTVQHILGHTKLEMTAKYLTPLKGKKAQDLLGASEFSHRWSARRENPKRAPNPPRTASAFTS